MNSSHPTKQTHGFTLMETVIAIGVVAVLLTGFMVVFGPAADGIRKSISSQEADRLVSALEQELVNTRIGEVPDPSADPPLTGFENALMRIQDSTGVIGGTDVGEPNDALLVYQYRGNPNDTPRDDGSPEPVTTVGSNKVGSDYTLVPMMRRKSSPLFLEDLKAIEGSLFVVKCVQLIYNDSNELVPLDNSERGKIKDPNFPNPEVTDLGQYPEAVLAFRSEFYRVPSKARGFFTGSGFGDFYSRSINPAFVRNMAVRR